MASKVAEEKARQEEMKRAREYVGEQELSARSYKAHYDKMHYALEAEKLEPEFVEFEKDN